MTVSYTGQVASTSAVACFLKLLVKWRGSIYKLVWKHLLIFLALYFSLSLLYRFILTESQKRVFETVAYYCDKHGSLLPVSFVLGFYVSLVVGRWWDQYKNIPWIDNLAIWINANLRGSREKDRLLRRTLMRYVCLSVTQCFILISPRIKKRFPTLEHLVDGGLLLENEKEIIREITASVPKYPVYWIPLVWAAGIVTRARAENKIKNDGVANVLLTELNKIRDACGMLMSYDWISVPLVYTQVVSLAVYTYFLSCVMGKQWLFDRTEHPDKINIDTSSDEKFSEMDVFLPAFTIMQFLFYMGWLKTAESLLNPFGDDDDDFELNWFVDRNLQVGYLIVDGMHKQIPDLLKDQYWDEVVPPELPHTVASDQYKEQPVIGSTSAIVVTEKGAEIVTGVGSVPHSVAIDIPSSLPRSRKSVKVKDEGCNTIQEEPLQPILNNQETIHWDALEDREQARPTVQDIFGIELKLDEEGAADENGIGIGFAMTPLDPSVEREREGSTTSKDALIPPKAESEDLDSPEKK